MAKHRLPGSNPSKDVAELVETMGVHTADFVQARARMTTTRVLQAMLGHIDGKSATTGFRPSGWTAARGLIAAELETRGELPNLAREIGETREPKTADELMASASDVPGYNSPSARLLRGVTERAARNGAAVIAASAIIAAQVAEPDAIDAASAALVAAKSAVADAVTNGEASLRYLAGSDHDDSVTGDVREIVEALDAWKAASNAFLAATVAATSAKTTGAR